VHDAEATLAAGLAVAGASAVAIAGAYPTSPARIAVVTVAGCLPAAFTALAVLHRRPRSTTAADRVTMGRAVLASGCGAVAATVLLGPVPARTWWLTALAVPTLLLDAVDGLVARRTGCATAAGARLDEQVDAGVLVVLCLAAAPAVGAWALLIGAMRYVFVVASWSLPVLRTPIPRSPFRRAVAGYQGAALVAVLAPGVPLGAATAAAGLALGLLVTSFGHQVLAIRRMSRDAGVH
jgi:phosphatidylglycerophosphate synthase